MITLLQTLVVLSGVNTIPEDLAATEDRVAAEISDPRHGRDLARQVEERLSRPSGVAIAAQDVAVLREALDSVFRVYASGDFGPAAATLERLRARIDASPISLISDLSLRAASYDIRVMLADCYRRTGREADATSLMADVVRGDPKRAPSSTRFSPDVIDFFKKVKRDLDVQSRGSLEVVTEPSGLPVYLGSDYVGQAPVKVGDLYPGRYEVLVGTPANASRLHEVTIQGDERVSIDHGFDRALRTRDGVAFVFRSDVDRQASESPFAAKLGRSLGAKQVIVLATGVHQDRRALFGSVIDVETARATRTAIVAMEPTAPGGPTFRALARFLMRGEAAPGLVTSGSAFATSTGSGDSGVSDALVLSTSSTPRSYAVPKWVSLGVAVAGLALGGVLMAMDGSCAEETRSHQCVETRDFQTPAIAGFAVGGAAAIATGIFFWLDAN